jgi:hypothetical protein
MKKMIGLFVAAVVGIAVLAQADTRTVALTVTNGQAITYSDPIPASGELDKIEISQTSTGATITVATYSGTTALETFATMATGTTQTKLFVPRRVGTTSAGVSIVAVVGSGSDALTNLATTVLSAPYEAPVIGGNVKLAVTAHASAATSTNTVTATLYFKPLAR